VLTFDDGTVQVQAAESGGPQMAAVVYELGPDLTVRGARMTDSFWEWHRRLEQEGRLAHSAELCPERQGLEIQHWTRLTGWTSVRIPVR
jgi:hypothetical protein